MSDNPVCNDCDGRPVGVGDEVGIHCIVKGVSYKDKNGNAYKYPIVEVELKHYLYPGDKIKLDGNTGTVPCYTIGKTD